MSTDHNIPTSPVVDSRELTAFEGGYGPYYGETQDALGSLSVAAARMAETQDDLDRAKANVAVLQKVIRNFPLVNGKDSVIDRSSSLSTSVHHSEVFVVPRENQQYIARQIQVNTLWLEDSNGWGQYYNHPYYVIGERDIPGGEEKIELLLMPAAIAGQHQDSQQDNYPRIIVLKKDALNVWMNLLPA